MTTSVVCGSAEGRAVTSSVVCGLVGARSAPEIVANISALERISRAVTTSVVCARELWSARRPSVVTAPQQSDPLFEGALGFGDFDFSRTSDGQD